MSEPWMPSDIEIHDAWLDATDDLPCDDLGCANPEPIRALIRAAAEKAVAEERAAFHETLQWHVDNECSRCGEIVCGDPLHFHHDGCPTEWADLQNERDEARRELERVRLEAKIEALDLALLTLVPVSQETGYRIRAVPQACILDAKEIVRAALAALDKEES